MVFPTRCRLQRSSRAALTYASIVFSLWYFPLAVGSRGHQERQVPQQRGFLELWCGRIWVHHWTETISPWQSCKQHCLVRRNIWIKSPLNQAHFLIEGVLMCLFFSSLLEPMNALWPSVYCKLVVARKSHCSKWLYKNLQFAKWQAIHRWVQFIQETTSCKLPIHLWSGYGKMNSLTILYAQIAVNNARTAKK